MSLNWDASKVNNWQEVVRTPDGTLNPVTEALLLHSMVCGFNAISQTNIREVWTRISLHEKLHGPFLVDRPLTYVDVRAHIGLRTNANTKTEVAFLKGTKRQYQDELDRLARVQQADAATPG